MTTHTPGPWTLETCDWIIGQSLQIARTFPRVPEMGWNDCPLEAERKANARLIAAAPDLLALLDEAQAALDVLACDIEDTFPTRAENTADLAMRARAAIAKAEGKS